MKYSVRTRCEPTPFIVTHVDWKWRYLVSAWDKFHLIDQVIELIREEYSFVDMRARGIVSPSFGEILGRWELIFLDKMNGVYRVGFWVGTEKDGRYI